jgi:cell division protein FtsL
MATAYKFNEEFEEYARVINPSAGAAGAAATRHRGVPHSADSVRNDGSGRTVLRTESPERILKIPRRTTLSRNGKKPAMVEFYTLKRIDNSRLVRHVEPVKLRNFYKTLLLGGIVALFCMFYVYQHFRCIDLSFQLEDLKAKQAQAQSLNSELKLEIETLRDPARIDVIAQKELGLKRPDAAQVREYGNADGSEVAAMQVRSVVSRR